VTPVNSFKKHQFIKSIFETVTIGAALISIYLFLITNFVNIGLPIVIITIIFSFIIFMTIIFVFYSNITIEWYNFKEEIEFEISSLKTTKLFLKTMIEFSQKPRLKKELKKEIKEINSNIRKLNKKLI
jgi:signal transduction histidine kinase